MNMAASNTEPGTRADSKSTVPAPVLLPGISEYADLRRDGYAYVDKTRELGHLLDTGKFLFLARPRRFGKTLMLSTIECMYQGHLPIVRGPDGQPVRPMPKVPDEQLFTGLVWEDEFAISPRRPVIRLDMSHVTGQDVAQLEQSLKLHIAEHALLWYERGYDPGVEMRYLLDSTSYPHAPQNMLAALLQSLRRRSNDPVVLVDEYDTPLLSLARLNPAEIEPYLNLFRDFFRVFKQCEGLLHKVLVTGITSRAYGDQFSALNNLVDCTWRPDLGSVCGFTEEDLDRPPLSTFIETAAAGLAQSTNALRTALRDHYNGYRFDRRGLSTAVYNPWSLCRTLSDLRVPELREEIRELGLPAHWSESGVAKNPCGQVATACCSSGLKPVARSGGIGCGPLQQQVKQFEVPDAAERLSDLPSRGGHPACPAGLAQPGSGIRDARESGSGPCRGITSRYRAFTCLSEDRELRQPANGPVGTACTPSPTTSWRMRTPIMPRSTACSLE